MDQNNHFSQYASAIRNLNLGSISHAGQIPSTFLLGQDRDLASYYIPFDIVNAGAKVVLVGITPGFTQWKNAMQEAQKQLASGAPLDVAHAAAKQTGGFSGALRPNLIALLDSIGLHGLLKVTSCDSLFGSNYSLVQTTSILRHPIFVGGKNYSGTPHMVKTPFLRHQILDHFAKEAAKMKNPLYIPLGPKVSKGLAWLAAEGVIKSDRILDGLPHPSGANAERIAYFLGRKKKEALSVKTNPALLDFLREKLVSQVAYLK
ncbi:hypothetical protein EDC30_11930 [Paucimonas lemoignei]|uniref:Uracil DNA glycosylase superfamily protein n=1 Tax=Paucimonas lemoignei TaxID=29443 RepID=A0A4R3HRR8_PAULE|nr:hypothetical protein [Paucimonas lemoignei]TCS32919.1 hypothetical protein EDC30_11930 [Paucimonas lemoignei]